MEKYSTSHYEVSTELEKTAQLAPNTAINAATTKEERKLVFKQDVLILPLMALSLFCGYLVGAP